MKKKAHSYWLAYSGGSKRLYKLHCFQKLYSVSDRKDIKTSITADPSSPWWISTASFVLDPASELSEACPGALPAQ